MPSHPARSTVASVALAALAALAGLPASTLAQHASDAPLKAGAPLEAKEPKAPKKPVSASSAPVTPIVCDRLYASDCNFGLWSIEPYLGVSTFLGPTDDILFDIALTPEQRMFGVDSSARLWEVDPATGAGSVVGALGGNGLGGDLASNDVFGQGPPLTRTETATYSTATVGGVVGPAPGEWCNISSGDTAMQPGTGVLFSSIVAVLLKQMDLCSSCTGDVLIRVSPTTGEVLSEVGCITTPTGTQLTSVHGLAFDSLGSLWALRGEPDTFIYRIDPATAIATPVPLTGGLGCGFGLASVPCVAP